jgi:anti-sigma factor RsiW
LNCRKVNHLLSAYMDGELPGIEHRQIHEHLARCSECADEYAGLLNMKRLLAGMRVREPRADLASHIVEQVHAHDAPRIGPSVRWAEQVNVWWKTGAPSPPALALGAGLAVMGVMAVSHVVDNRETIHWNTASASVLAGQTLAPEDALPTQAPAFMHMDAGVSNVGNIQSRPGPPEDDAFAPQSSAPRGQMRWYFVAPPGNFMSR